jgi:hypothetical protein
MEKRNIIESVNILIPQKDLVKYKILLSTMLIYFKDLWQTCLKVAGTGSEIRTRLLNLNENIFISLYAKIISMDTRNKVTIITGASEDIRLATAKLFTKNDAKVAFATRSKDKLNKLAA